MNISSVQTTTGPGDAPASPPPAPAPGAAFAQALAGQQQIEAARDVLATLPAPIAYTLRDQPGSPSEAVDRLFEVLKDGSFTPPDGPLGAPTSIIGATARAAELFDTPQQLWDSMRSALQDSSALSMRRSDSPRSGSAAPASPHFENTASSHALARQALATTRPGDSGSWEAALLFFMGPDTPSS